MSDIHFGTDGWRAIIGEGFTAQNVVRTTRAAAEAFRAQALAAGRPADALGVLYIGHDCRQDAHQYAVLAANTAAELGFCVKLTADFCPTPTLCWSVAHDPEAQGGIMLTSSHNPAEYLGIKLRMADGGASGKEFTDEVERIIDAQDVEDVTGGAAQVAAPTTPEELAALTPGAGVEVVDLMTAYLEALKQLVDVDAIADARLRVVVDPLFGAGRGHLAGLLRGMGVEVVEVNNACDPTFDGLHPEPIQPWVDRGLAKVAELGYDALFINDGDADRIAAGDSHGNYVNAHRVIALVTQHMVNRGATGRVVSTVTASALLDRLCRKLGLELVSTPVGFKWIYAEMEKGNVMIGGEESGGIGLPGHVKERDGLLMALLLTEMMAKTGKDLGTLVQEMLDELGHLEFLRRGLSVSDAQMATFKNDTVPNFAPAQVVDKAVVGTDRRDGVKFMLEGDAWVMMRPSGTEPLIRIYAEAETLDQVNALLDWAEAQILK